MPDSTLKLSKRTGVDALQKIRAKDLHIQDIMLSATCYNAFIAEAICYSATRSFLKIEIGTRDLNKTVKGLLGV